MQKKNHELSRMLNLPSIWRVACHTDNVGPGSTFVAIKGDTFDGINFLSMAIKKGAKRIVVDDGARLPQKVVSFINERNVLLSRVSDTRLALAQLSAEAYNHPANKLKLTAITGTKGKTTTAYIAHHMLQQAGLRVALLTSVENKIGQSSFKAPLTTAQPDYLHMFFDVCVQQNITHVVMEVAAQALSLHRVYGLQFDVAAFTNFAHEHMEFYASMNAYYDAKCLLLNHLKPQAPLIINADDKALKNIDYEHIQPIALGDVDAMQVTPKIMCTLILDRQTHVVRAPYLMGVFNLYNILCAIHIVRLCSISMKVIESLATFKGVPGRMQKHVLPNGASCFIDYAHTPDSYQHVLSLLRSLTDHLIVVFGCGGLRDKVKRPLMGNVAAHFADIVILANDNPRTESPDEIINDIKQGIKEEEMHKIMVVLNRDEAIKKAYACSRKDAIIAILGKGPDAYQIIGATRHDFSDTQVVTQLN